MMREISMFSHESSSSKVPVSFKYTERCVSEYKTLLMNGDDFTNRKFDVVCGNFDCTKWKMKFEGKKNVISCTIKPVCVERKLGKANNVRYTPIPTRSCKEG